MIMSYPINIVLQQCLKELLNDYIDTNEVLIGS